MPSVLHNQLAYLKGVGPKKADLLKQELRITTYEDLLFHFPFRYEDKSKIYSINQLTGQEQHVQLLGKFIRSETIGEGRKKRLVAHFVDQTGEVEIIWFKGVDWVRKYINTQDKFLVFGKPTVYGKKINFAHPEVEVVDNVSAKTGFLQPIYHTTEKLKKGYVDSRAIGNWVRSILTEVKEWEIKENLTTSILTNYRFVSRYAAMQAIHFPTNWQDLQQAQERLKFEELFFFQLKLAKQKSGRKVSFIGQKFESIPTVTEFYSNHVPFDLTNAQKRVVKEIRVDVNSGVQMNRLLQGDVGSGKTIVAFISMLMALDNGTQACLIAPTEILASQHYQGLKEYVDKLSLSIGILTGSSKTKERNQLLEELKAGELQILVGTHALLEDRVQFQNLGLCVIDEQHRFGVAQRAKLWKKNEQIIPHVLVMTATPIPRTLAMTLYGDLDVSVIDELPPGRKPIQTVHRFEGNRLRVLQFIEDEVKKGRQVYIVYPLIEESEKLDLNHLMDGYESISRRFPLPDYSISVVHGRMKPADKEYEMQRFVTGKTQIMVATTVIEVGVNVPNASVMIIENAERFGLSQLHQLRGRVGRGAEQSYCILMSGHKLSKEAKVRIDAMCRTNDGFEIADVDLKLRGPGEIDGTQQSGVLDLKIADLGQDGLILQHARKEAFELMDDDPSLEKEENLPVKEFTLNKEKGRLGWGKIS
ncbi:MAG: ATP-dependent DNA helicase RecG [Cyclobacteriaceae bacterium]